MLPDYLYNRRLTGVLSFLALFLGILTLFVLLSSFIPLTRGVGWFWLAFFLFLFFVGEPFYRRFTNRFEHHVLVLEFYLFSVYFMQLFFSQSPYAHLFYLIPIFSAALSFGLMGTMLTSSFAFLLEVVRVSPPWHFAPAALPPLLPDILPLFILALLLGFTVELKNHTQRQLLHRLSKMDAFQALKEVIDSTGEKLPFTEELIATVVQITEVRGGLIHKSQSEDVIASHKLKNEQIQEILTACEAEKKRYQNGEIYRVQLPWAETAYELVLWGSRLQGVLLDAEEEMIRALAMYLQHFVDHLRIQHEKNKSYQLQEALIEAVPLGIIVADSRGAVVEMNRSAGNLLSVSPESAIGQRVKSAITLEEQDLQLVETREEVTVVSQAGEIPVDLSISVADLGQSEEQWIIVFSDLRPLKELQRKAERRRRLLALGEFAAGMAHEIRNPLGSLSGFLSLLREKLRELETKESLENLLDKVQSSYNRIDALVEDFLLYAREPQPETENFQLRQFLETRLEDFEPGAEVDFSYDISEADCIIEANQRRLGTALMNLLRNARDAVGENGKITLEAPRSQETVMIKVKDNGPGISEGRVDEVFDPFYSDKEEGLGLGLSIVHRIITEELDGDITINSEVGEGTEITLTIPKTNSTQINAD